MWGRGVRQRAKSSVNLSSKVSIQRKSNVQPPKYPSHGTALILTLEKQSLPPPPPGVHLRVQHIPLIHWMGLMTFFETKVFFEILDHFWPLRKKIRADNMPFTKRGTKEPSFHPLGPLRASHPRPHQINHQGLVHRTPSEEGGVAPPPPPPPGTPPQDQRDHRGKQRNVPWGTSCRAIWGTQTFGSQPPPPPPVPPPLLILPGRGAGA